ncbi:unnamed protein product [Nyctereutes procyonoides]|uniref:(raccoon dog) hypothetical protein n=1 Tax=Nyctereutes procyonoides TaxID=34880 RepID=A0A811ZIX8_NYCPR|nr:unnamed protein product [Nyctereutes procyonoides]
MVGHELDRLWACQVAPAPGLAGAPHTSGLPTTQQNWRKVHGNEYQPNNIKSKHKPCWIWHLSTLSSIQIVLHHLHESRKSLSH